VRGSPLGIGFRCLESRGDSSNERLWLDSADPAWIYVPREVHEECWAGIRPDSKTHTREVAFSVRKLSFGSGYAPAENIRVAQVEGRPLITK